jgi:UDP-glucose:glycoprotein glucosyltransferase
LKTITDKIGSSPIDVTFELKQLVIEGHAREGANVPPRGLQLQLSIGDGPALADTQVVANLGYFQFKADPGVVQLSIREGRGREIYDIESVGSYGWDSPSVDVTGADVAVTSFAGATIYPRFVRKPGMEGVDVLAEVPEVTMKTGIAAVDNLLDR